MFLPSLIFLLLASTAILPSNADSKGKGRSSCREPSVMKNFDLTGVLGRWYEYSRHHHDFETGCDCFTTEVIEIDTNSVEISNCCQMTGVSNDTQTCNIGVNFARLTDPMKKEASFQYTRTGVTVESHLWIVDTDYKNYAIVNGCDRVSDDEEREIFWIMSRDKEIDADEAKKIEEVLRLNSFERKKIIKQRHGSNVCRSKRPERGHHSGRRDHEKQRQ